VNDTIDNIRQAILAAQAQLYAADQNGDTEHYYTASAILAELWQAFETEVYDSEVSQ
jgi:hypothetical protein